MEGYNYTITVRAQHIYYLFMKSCLLLNQQSVSTFLREWGESCKIELCKFSGVILTECDIINR